MTRLLYGDSWVALRMLSAVAAAGTVFLVGDTSRELGGGSWARLLAQVLAATAPIYLSLFSIYSMNGIDVLIWAGLVGIVVHILGGDGETLWLGGAVAAALFLPHIAWQVVHGWPTREFVANAQRDKITPLGPIGFVAKQFVMVGPVGFSFALAGLGWLLAGSKARAFRPIGSSLLCSPSRFSPKTPTCATPQPWASIPGRTRINAAAIDYFGPALGLPPAISQHNSYWIWGPGSCTGEVILIIGGELTGYIDDFSSVEPEGVFRCADCMPYESDLTI